MIKKRIFISLCVLLLIMVAFFFFAVHQAQKLQRDPVVLMNKYYHFKNSNPEAAKKALHIILNQDNHYLPAHKELSQWLLYRNNMPEALHSLEQLNALLPDNETYKLQLGYLYYLNGDWEKSARVYAQIIDHVSSAATVKAQQALLAMTPYLPNYQHYASNEQVYPTHFQMTQVVTKSLYPKDQTIVPSYKLYSFKEKSTRHVLKPIINKHPDHVQALKESGYSAIVNGHRIDAISYFTRAYDLTGDSVLAMQLAYLYDQANNKPAAYYYFKLATRSPDKQLSLRAENALTNLGGQQTKALPAPYFSETFFNPFTQSRFGLTVRPFLWRFGKEQSNRLQSKTYLFFRRTDDNRSVNLGEISQIFEDNVQITGVGAQVTPFSKFPLIGFVETGAAYDLVYRNRNRWRADLRAGFMYYQEFGARPAYFDKLTISSCYYSNWYADATYFSRYNNNVIGLIRTHQGIRLLQYHSSMLNLYVAGRVITDTRREFFNNIGEIGPGIAFIPTNRFNLQLRFEHINGVYLPAGGSVNPYGKYYSNNLVQLNFYVKL